MSVKPVLEQDALARKKEELLAILMEEEGICVPESSQIIRQTNTNRSQLSFAQQRLWFLNQLEQDSSNSPVYNIHVAIRISGLLDVSALKKSLARIIKRHESLRATFVEEDGQPVQVISPGYGKSPLLVLVELQNLSEPDQEAEIERLAVKEACQPFDLSQGPLIRAVLLQAAETYHVFLLTMHHIVSDEWSTEIFFRELGICYDSFISGNRSSSLPELPIRYSDYAAWQRQNLQTDAAESELTYWRRQLADIPPLLELPADRLRPGIQLFKGASRSFVIPAPVTEAVRQLCRREDVTLFMMLLAVFNVLLHRYTGQTDIVVGSPIANRNRSEIEGLIGFFVNTLVLRTSLADNPVFCHLLKKVRETALEAYAHQDIPFDQLVEALQPERNLSYQPLFQVMFVLQNSLMETAELSGLKLSRMSIDNGTTKFDLALFIEENERELTGRLNYNTDLFDPETIDRMAGHFQTLLAGIVDNPDQRVANLPILTDAELQQLVRWNDNRVEYSEDMTMCIHRLFEAQVEKTPDRIAVVFEDESLTFHELNCRANQLAHYLITLGAAPEICVGICLERSVEVIVALMGVLKTGAAYMPMNPDLPNKRLSFMIENACVPVLLTQQRLIKKFSGSLSKVICMDTNWDAIARMSEENTESMAESGNLAYVLFTSGSTGMPKGVAVEHRQLSNYLNGILERLNLPSGASFAMVSTFAADLGNTAIFPALCTGGVLHILSQERAIDPDALADYFRSHPIDCLKIVPSHMTALLSASNPEQTLPRLLLILGGEAAGRVLIEQLQNLAPDCSIINHYGPTETTVGTITYRADQFQKDGQNEFGGESNNNNNETSMRVPIGRPISNTCVYLLDRHLNPVPVGVVGELYIGGNSVARGYLYQPVLTAEKFIPNPFADSDRSGQRMYKTGDLARYLPDGNIEFLGRIDQQIKIRGFRIELEEIESVLSQHHEVRDAVVLVREDVPGDKRLIAYVVENQNAPDFMRQDLVEQDLVEQEKFINIEDLRSFLEDSLPDYMIPSVFIVIDALPLTPNGKIDRNALPEPDAKIIEDSKTYIGPQTPVEKMLADIWKNILRLDIVGIYDNFFQAGGHSLLATRIMSRIYKAFQVKLPLKSLFETPTIAGLAERIELAKGQNIASTGDEEILPVPRDGSLLLSFAQERLWFLDQLDPASPAYNIPIAIRMTGSLHTDALEQSLNEIILRHEVLRTTFSEKDGHPIQIICPVTDYRLSIVDLTASADQEAAVTNFLSEFACRPFDLSRGPLLKSALLRLGQDGHVLVLVVHHIVSDAWSRGVLMRELSVLYEAFASGKTLSALPALSVQYADFAQWQRQWLNGREFKIHLDYWKQQLGDGASVLQLPVDRPRPSVQTYNGSTCSFCLPSSLVESLRALSQEAEVTLFMLLLAAFKVLLFRYTGQNDIVVGTPIANRNHHEIETLIGFFVNTLVLRTDMSGNPEFKEFLDKVRKISLDAYSHQDMPFEKLVEKIQPERNLSHPPLFQVMFIFQNTPTETLELQGLTLSPLDVHTRTAKFDLSLEIEDSEQGLKGLWEYNTDLFDAATIDRLTGHWKTLLKGIVASPEMRLSELPVLTEPELHQLLVEWNDTEKDYPKDKCIHELFEAQVERTPGAVAIVFEDEQMSYRELNNRANQLAHYLNASGLETEAFVGIYAERSLEMMVALLAVMKAGGTYIPLDPTYPQERLAFMAEDAQLSFLLTQEQFLENLPTQKAHLICLDSDWGKIAGESKKNLNRRVIGDNLVYVIYTSGSTGKPKGVQISHRALVNFLESMRKQPGLTKQDILLAVTTLSFDIAGLELYLPLISGATAVLVSREIAADGVRLSELISESGATVMEATPATWRLLLESGWQGSDCLKALCGGEALPRDLANRLIERVDSLWNLYGPTETTIWSAVYEVKPGNESILIGRPIANTQIYILNESLHPVPTGVSGELHIGGDGLSRGYLNRPDLTAEKFIPDPFARTIHSDSLPARLYKTGDLARYLPDGNIEYIARIDHQIKIRGFRIELGEIETLLSQYSEVRENVIIAQKDNSGSDRLIAYIVPSEASGHDASMCSFITDQSSEEQPLSTKRLHSELQSYLKEKLPDYMIPSIFVFLNSLPLTPNGKIDRRALPAPDNTRPDLIEAYAAPRDLMEFQLARIWTELLNIYPVGVNDNFFILGGHSLLAVRLISQIRKTFEQDLPLAVLFQEPTIEHLASVLRRKVVFTARSPLVGINTSGSKQPIFCVHPIGGNVLCYSGLAYNLGPDQPFYGLQAFGIDGEHEPLTCIQDMAASYIKAMYVVQPDGPYIVGGWSMGGVVAFEMAQQLQKQGHQVDMLFLLDSWPTLSESSLLENGDNGRLMFEFLRDLSGTFAKNMRISYDNLRQLHLDERMENMLDQIASLMPPDFGRREILRLMQVFMAGYRAVSTYKPRKYPGRIVLFRSDDSMVNYSYEPSHGWSELSGHPVNIHPVPGNHYTMLTMPNVQELAKQLTLNIETLHDK